MRHQIFTEKELESIFSGKKAKEEKKKWFNFFKVVLSFFVITGVIFVTLNYNELGQNVSFWYNANFTDSKKEEAATPDYGQQIISQITNQASGNPNSSGDSNNSGAPNTQNLPPLPALADSHLKIPTINTDAPITWKVPNDPTKVTENLKNGLIQIDGTALPGEKGNVFITGHSSNYPWIKSPYNNVFALLNKVVVGDVVHLKYQNQDYLYRVSNIKVTDPNDLSVMKQTSTPILTLMTCTPVGTSLRRLIVTATQYFPDPSTNRTTSAAKQNMKMPKKVH